MSPLPEGKYRAAVLEAPRRIELRERELPELAPHEARVRVHAAGVCGTDLAIHDGGYPVPLPLVLGHEWVGTVEAIGGDVGKDLADRRVVGEINNYCAAIGRPEPCAACERSMPTHCVERTVTGIIAHDGAFAERVIVPAENLRVVPDAMSDETAVFVEPLAAALQTFAMTPMTQRRTVAVLGCGRLGVLIAAVAKSLDARVLAYADREEYAELGARLGISVTVGLAPGEIVGDIKESTQGLGAKIVVEATGSPGGLALALDCVRARGTVALKSTPGVPVERFDLTRVVVDEIRLQGSRCGDFTDAIEFWNRHRPPLERLIEAEFPLDRIADAIERARRPGKVLVRCSTP